MTLPAVDSDPVAARLSLIRPHLDERARRLVLGAEARRWVTAGSSWSPRRAGCSRIRWRRAWASWRPTSRSGRARRPGAGRPPMAVTDPDLVAALDALVDPASRGDPESPLRWTTKSMRAAGRRELTGRRASRCRAPTVAQAAQGGAGYSLQANAKTIEGAQHPDRDAQFRYLNDQVARAPGRRGPGDQRGHQEEGAGRRRTRTVAGNGSPTGEPEHGQGARLHRPSSWARRSRTGSTTSPPTPAGCPSAPTTTPPSSPWPPSARWWQHDRIATATRRRRGC